MLYSGRTDAYEGIVVNKTSASEEIDIYHNWHFLDQGFKFQPHVCNRCHDVLMISINLSNTAVLNINGVEYRCII